MRVLLLLLTAITLSVATRTIEKSKILGKDYTLTRHLQLLMYSRQAALRMYNGTVFDIYCERVAQIDWTLYYKNQIAISGDVVTVYLQHNPNQCIVLHELMHLLYETGLDNYARPLGIDPTVVNREAIANLMSLAAIQDVVGGPIVECRRLFKN